MRAERGMGDAAGLAGGAAVQPVREEVAAQVARGAGALLGGHVRAAEHCQAEERVSAKLYSQPGLESYDVDVAALRAGADDVHFGARLLLDARSDGARDESNLPATVCGATLTADTGAVVAVLAGQVLLLGKVSGNVWEKIFCPITKAAISIASIKIKLGTFWFIVNLVNFRGTRLVFIYVLPWLDWRLILIESVIFSTCREIQKDGSAEEAAKRKLNKILSKLPEKGDFDLNNVLQSVYFFS